jgi:NADPH-dependent 2,4-dienoyl-CoA reductase/sulfur reductase-like enzyme
MSRATCDVAIVGAGPYGLSAAAHLRHAGDLDVRVFGEPMSFWTQSMPAGMLLRSPYVASSLSAPGGTLTLDHYASACGSVARPVPLERFVDYGRWFQRQVVPDVDRRWVSQLERAGAEFRLRLADGDVLTSRRVVLAAGISACPRLPPLFGDLPPSLASHPSRHRDLGTFAGRRVAVVGGGQSALESAALLHEHGADVEVLVRAPRIFYLRRAKGWLHQLGPVTSLLFAPAEVGPAGVSRLVSLPSWYRWLPRGPHERLAIRALRPAGAAWLRPRLEDVPIATGRAVAAAGVAGDRVRLRLDDGSSRLVDHVLLCTGYQVHLGRYGFLAPELLARVERRDGLPRLSGAFETSVPGLHVLGAAAAGTFGPLMRFVAGAEFAAPRLAQGIVRPRRIPRAVEARPWRTLARPAR